MFTKLSAELRKICLNIGWLFAERILKMMLSFCVGIYVIRYLDLESFGKLSYSISFVSLFRTFTKLGLDQIVVRDIVQEEKATAEILGTAFLLKLMASSVTVVALGMTVWNFNQEPDVVWMILVIAVSLLFTPFDVLQLWFQSQVLSGVIALLGIVTLVLTSLARLSFIAFQLPLMAFVWLFLAQQMFKTLGMVVVYLRHHQSIRQWRFNWSKGRELLKDSWLLILSGAMVTIYMKIDQVMLGNMAPAQAVANYAAAVKFSEIWYFIPTAICASVFPAIIRARQRSQKEYSAKLQQLYDLMAWMAISISLCITIASEPLIATLLGQKYAEAGKILAWHIWAGPFVFLGIAGSKWLIAENLTGFIFLKTFLGAIVNIWLNFLLIPSYGGVGAALATAVSQGVSCYLILLLYPATIKTGWMLTKALCVMFRFRQNLVYFQKLRKFFLTVTFFK